MPSFTCFRWLFCHALSNLKLFNQVRPFCIGSNLGVDEFYFILVHGSKMLYLAFKSLTYEQILNQMTCRMTAVSARRN